MPFVSQIFPVGCDLMTESTNGDDKPVNFSWYSCTTSGGSGCSVSLGTLKSWLWTECKCVLRPVADLNQQPQLAYRQGIQWAVYVSASHGLHLTAGASE